MVADNSMNAFQFWLRAKLLGLLNKICA